MPRWDAIANRFRRSETATPVASAARTASGNSGQIDAGDIAHVDLLVDVTAVSGTTPSMTVTLEESTDGTTWTAVTGATTGAITAVSAVRLRGSIQRKYYRVVWAITGTTPSFTFSVAGDVK